MNGIFPKSLRVGLTGRGNKPNVRSRAYAKFRNIDALATFHRAFNGHTFTDSKGRSSRAMIEFAPFQKSVKGRIKPDARQGTIDTSPEYKEFLDSLAEPTSSEPVTLSVQEEPTTTPLIEYLRHQKAVKAEKERTNKEKARLAKIAALQAKANEQSAKLRADKLAKTEGSQTKGVDTVKEGKQVGVPPSRGGGRGGRGGGGRGRDAPRGKSQAQKPQSSGKNRQVQNNATIVNEPAAPIAADTSNAGTVQNVKSPAQPPAIANDSPSEGGISGGSVEHPGRGGRGGGRGRGRSRPYGVYRPGGGRGGRRGGNSGGGNDTKAPTTAGDG